MGRHSITHNMIGTLRAQTRLGTSKRADRIEHNGANKGRAEFIHSIGTLRTYEQQARQFGRWCEEHGHKYASRAEARELARDYIHEQHSTWSQHTARSALARALDCEGRDLCDDLEPRRARDITRGRRTEDEREREDYHRADGRRDRAAEAERTPQGHEIAEACRACGLRHHRELEQLTARDLWRDERGDLYAHVTGKGGRERDALVLPGEGRDIIERWARDREPEERLCPDIPHGLNVHAARADYAARAYDYAMEHGYGDGREYRPRDGSGTSWDKGALDAVAGWMGHGEGREYTTYSNYLSYGRT